MTDADRRQLDEQGYLILPGLMTPTLLDALRRRMDELLAEEGERAGSEFKTEPGARRLANLVNKGEIFEQIKLMPKVLEAVACVLGPKFKLCSLNARSADPHSESGQAGTVAIMNAHIWHRGTANWTSQPRRALHVYYTRWDKPQQQWQKKWLGPEVQRRLPAEARRILALDDPLNDAVCATGSGMSGFMK